MAPHDRHLLRQGICQLWPQWGERTPLLRAWVARCPTWPTCMEPGVPPRVVLVHVSGSSAPSANRNIFTPTVFVLSILLPHLQRHAGGFIDVRASPVVWASCSHKGSHPEAEPVRLTRSWECRWRLLCHWWQPRLFIFPSLLPTTELLLCKVSHVCWLTLALVIKRESEGHWACARVV